MTSPNGSFLKTIEKNIEATVNSKIETARQKGFLSLFLSLFLNPLLAFIAEYVLKLRFLNGRKGYEAAVRSSLFFFSANARIFEIEKGQYNKIKLIKKEWERKRDVV